MTAREFIAILILVCCKLDSQVATGLKVSRMALLIGINPPGDRATGSCITDVVNFRELLLSQGFPDESIITMTDYARSTGQSIVDTIEYVSEKLLSGGLFVFFYSGHGVPVPDKDGDEKLRCKNLESRDTCLGKDCDDNLTNHDQAYQLYQSCLLDDALFLSLTKIKNSRIFHITNSCFSGTIYKMIKAPHFYRGPGWSLSDQSDGLEYRIQGYLQDAFGFSSEIIHYGATSDSRTLRARMTGGNSFVLNLCELLHDNANLTYFNAFRKMKKFRESIYYSEYSEDGCFVSDAFRFNSIFK